MELIGLVLAIPGTLVASLAYCLCASSVLNRYPKLHLPILMFSPIMIASTALEFVFYQRIGALGLYNMVGPAYLTVHDINFLLTAPSVANIVLIGGHHFDFSKAMRQGLAILFCWFLAWPTVFFNVVVDEDLFGIDGVGGPLVRKQ
ncbi:MAG: hypothetical protein K8R88_09135 [Armatimonadetes bacterium]|nr:hypothetical protein [Armatimonadota bacterium]